MARHEVINLLSSDDEAPAQISNLQKINGTRETQTKTGCKGFAFSSDDLDDDVDFNGWIDKPAKRRKQNLPLRSEESLTIHKSFHTTGSVSPREFATRPTTVIQREKEWANLSDPIIFTSSPHGKEVTYRPRKLSSPPPPVNNESGDELPDDPRSLSLQHQVVSQVSDRTAALLASLKAPAQKNASCSRKKIGKHVEAREKGSLANSEDEYRAETSKIVGKVAAVKSSIKSKAPGDGKVTKAQEKEASKAAEKARKTKEKEDEKVKKQLAKEEKAREKQIAADLAEVNRSRMDKKLTTPEMIVDLPASIDGQSVVTQAREILKNLGVDTNVHQSLVPNVIRWRRNADRVYNAEKGRWDPLHKTVIQEEKHVLCLMTAKDFVTLATSGSSNVDSQDLEWHVRKLKNCYGDCTLIYLIEGLNAWMRKNKTIQNRAYQAAVLNQDSQGNGCSANEKQAPKRKRPTDQYIDEDMIEDALLRLQVINDCLIHHTAASVETAEWIANFTQHISTIPYKYLITLPLFES